MSTEWAPHSTLCFLKRDMPHFAPCKHWGTQKSHLAPLPRKLRVTSNLNKLFVPHFPPISFLEQSSSPHNTPQNIRKVMISFCIKKNFNFEILTSENLSKLLGHLIICQLCLSSMQVVKAQTSIFLLVTHAEPVAPMNFVFITSWPPQKSCKDLVNLITQTFGKLKATHRIIRDSLTYRFKQNFLVASREKLLLPTLQDLPHTLFNILNTSLLFLEILEGKLKYYISNEC